MFHVNRLLVDGSYDVSSIIFPLKARKKIAKMSSVAVVTVYMGQKYILMTLLQYILKSKRNAYFAYLV